MVWHKNGTLYRQARYENGLLEGEERLFYPNGQLKRRAIWKQDSIISGVFFNEDGTQKAEVFKEDVMEKELLVLPSFPGGEGALWQFMNHNINYPTVAKENNIQGIVNVRFVIEKNGTLSHIELIKPLNNALDKESLRVMTMMPKWIPGSADGIPVKVEHTLPFRYKLE
jgi:TonB family protein